MDLQDTDLTVWLQKVQTGDKDAERFVFTRLYRELYRIATRHLKSERTGHSLQPTLLVNEAYLRLFREPDRCWKSRSHFLAVAAQVMRFYLVDNAKAKMAAKRGGKLVRIELGDDISASSHNLEELLSIHGALERLADMDPRAARMIEMQYFGGMTEDEIAEYCEVSTRTVRREIKAAKSWLKSELGAGMSASVSASR